MPNFLEQITRKWYEYQGYFVRQNVNVGPRARGGYDCEIDIVAFHPKTKHLVHVVFASNTNHKTVGGGKLLILNDFLDTILP